MTVDALLGMNSIKAHIRQVCGLMFEDDKEDVLIGALQTRMSALKLSSTEDYLKCIAEDGAEFQVLVNLLTINETYFFRESQHLDLLTTHIVPRMLEQRRDFNRPIRILCAGCASGEEPYSLAIALMETFGSIAPQQFAITAADIDSNVLDRARQGVYAGLSFRNLSAERVARWFKPYEKARFRLKDMVRNMVNFRQLNLLEDVYPNELMGQDIILFRNVSIYFDTDVRKSVQAKFAELLNEEGVLIVGLTETLPNDFGILSLTMDHGVFYFVKAPPGHLPAKAVSVAQAPRPVVVHAKLTPPPLVELKSEPAVSVPVSFDHAMLCLREKRYDEALGQIECLVQQNPGDARLYILRAHIAFNRKDMDLAKAAVSDAQKYDEWNLDALMLLAQIARHTDQMDQAVKWLKQVVYHQAQCWPAHYWLAEIYRNIGDLQSARREYRIVINQTTGDGIAGAGLLLFPLGVSPAEVGALCAFQLNKLGAE